MSPIVPDWMHDPGRVGPLCIAGGLGLVLAHLSWPALPVISGIALIALGSTIATSVRYGREGRLRHIIAAHLFAYGNLYLVFLGAICHAAMTGTRHSLSWWQAADLISSVVPMALAARMGIAAYAGGDDASSR